MVSEKSHRIKCETTDEAFRSSDFCGIEELRLVWLYYMHKNLLNTLKETCYGF